MCRFNAFFRNVDIINSKNFPTHGGIYKFERKFNKHSGERERQTDRETERDRETQRETERDRERQRVLRSSWKYERMYL